MTISRDPSISIDITSLAGASSSRPFPRVLVILTGNSNIDEFGSLTLNSSADVTDSEDLSNAEKEALNSYFRQKPQNPIKVVNISQADTVPSSDATVSSNLLGLQNAEEFDLVLLLGPYRNNKWAAAKLSELATLTNSLGFVVSTHSDELTYGTNSILKHLQDENLKDVVFTYISNSTRYTDFAIAGKLAGVNYDAGDSPITLNNQILTGITGESLNSTQFNSLVDKYGNVFTSIAGRDLYRPGKTIDNEWADITFTRSWLHNRLLREVTTLLTSGNIITYDGIGVAKIEGVVRSTLEYAKDINLLYIDEEGDSGYTITVQSTNDVSASTRASRTAPTVFFTARLAGAIHHTTIEGEVIV